MPSRLSARGFTYLAVLFAVAIMGTVLGASGLVWHTVAQREKEQELLFIGHAFRAAIGLYYERTPGTVKQYPKTLDDLLEDKRQVQLARYLRQHYRDPFTSSKDWGLVPGPGDTIMGVYSLSTAAPMKLSNFDEADQDFENKTSVQDWKFVYTPKARTGPANAVAPSTSAAPGTPGPVPAPAPPAATSPAGAPPAAPSPSGK